MKTWTKRFPIVAGKAFQSLKIVGYKIVEFTENEHGQLIAEKEIKRVIK